MGLREDIQSLRPHNVDGKKSVPARSLAPNFSSVGMWISASHHLAEIAAIFAAICDMRGRRSSSQGKYTYVVYMGLSHQQMAARLNSFSFGARVFLSA